MDNKEINEKMYDPKNGNLISKYCQNPACPKFYDKAENEKDKFCPYCGTKYPIVVNSSNDVKTPWWNKILLYILNHPVVFSFIIAIISFAICLVYFYHSDIFKLFKFLWNYRFIRNLTYSFIVAIISFIVAIVVYFICIVVYFICHHYLINKQKKRNKKL